MFFEFHFSVRQSLYVYFAGCGWGVVRTLAEYGRVWYSSALYVQHHHHHHRSSSFIIINVSISWFAAGQKPFPTLRHSSLPACCLSTLFRPDWRPRFTNLFSLGVRIILHPLFDHPIVSCRSAASYSHVSTIAIKTLEIIRIKQNY